MSDKEKGLYHKFNVTRTDGSSEPGGKHEDCRYFVLDLNCDLFARQALKTYIELCEEDYPQLARDLKFEIFDEYFPDPDKRFQR